MPSPAYDGPQMGYGVLHCLVDVANRSAISSIASFLLFSGARRLERIKRNCDFDLAKILDFRAAPVPPLQNYFTLHWRRVGKNMAALRSLDRTARRVAGARFYQTAFGCVEGVQSLCGLRMFLLRKDSASRAGRDRRPHGCRSIAVSLSQGHPTLRCYIHHQEFRSPWAALKKKPAPEFQILIGTTLSAGFRIRSICAASASKACFFSA